MVGLGAALAAEAFVIGGVGGLSVSYGALLYGGVTIYGLHDANKQAKRAAGAADRSLRDRNLIMRSNESPRDIVFGRTRTSGNLIYACVHGARRDNIYALITLASHEIESVDDIWFENESIGPLDADGRNIEGRYIRGATLAASYRVSMPGTTAPLKLKHTPSADDPITIGLFTAGTDEGSNSASPQVGKYLEYGVDYTVEGDDLKLTQLGLTRAGAGTPMVISYSYKRGDSLITAHTFTGTEGGFRNYFLEQASPFLPDGVTREWTAAHLGKGVAMLGVNIEFDYNIFATSFPDFSAIVKGAKLYDPRDSQTRWSDNPALATRYYLTSPLGYGAPSDWMDDGLDAENANICDESVQIADDAFEKRYTCNGKLYTEQNRGENLSSILSSMAGKANLSAGKYRVLAGAYRMAAGSLDDTDMARGNIETKPRYEFDKVVNSVNGQFKDPDAFYQTNDFPPYRSDTYIAEDNGQEYPGKLSLPMTQSATTAQRLAKIMLFRGRQGLTDTASYQLAASAFQYGDNVEISRAIDGWDAKEFEVIDSTLDPNSMTVRIKFQETAPEIWDEDYDEWVNPEPAPNTNLPDPAYVPPLVNLRVSSSASTATRLPDGTIIGYALVEWDPIDNDVVLQGGRVIIKWKRANELEYRTLEVKPSENADECRAKLEPISRGETLNVYGYAMNGSQRESQYVFTSHVTDPSLPGPEGSNASGNLLQNPDFRYGATDWRLVPANTFPAVGTGPTRDGAKFYAETGQSSLVYPNRAGIIGGAIDGELEVYPPNEFSVKAGQYVAAGAQLYPYGSQAATRIRFVDASGAYLQSLQSDVIDSIAGAPPTTTSDGFVQSSLIVRAPDGAVSARVSFWHKHVAVHTNPTEQTVVYKPQVSVMDSAPSELPPWQPGPSGGVNTGQILDGAVSQTKRKTVDLLDVWSTGPLVLLGTFQLVADTQGQIARLLISGSYQLHVPGKVKSAFVMISNEQLLGPSGSTDDDFLMARNPSTTIADAVGAFTREATFEMAVGPNSFWFYAYAGLETLSGAYCNLRRVSMTAQVLRR